MVFDTLRKLWEISNRGERRSLSLVFCAMILSGIADVISVASVLPFLALVSDPGLLETNSVLIWLVDLVQPSSSAQFLTYLGGAVLLLILFSALVRMAAAYTIARFAQMRSYHLSCRLLETYLRQPYVWFVMRNSSDLSKTILTEVAQATGSVIVPLLRLVAHMMSLIFILGFLIAVEPAIALSVLAVFAVSYISIFVLVRRYLTRLGELRVTLNAQRFRIANEVLHGIKDVKLMGLEQNYMNTFRPPSQRMARAYVHSQIAGELPRYALEAITFGGMIILILALLRTNDGSLSAALPVLGLFAVAGLRLLPALQAAYHSLAMMRTGRAVFLLVYGELMTFAKSGAAPAEGARSSGTVRAPVQIRRDISLRDARYRYPETDRDVLDGLTLTIPVRTTVGIVGSSGAGKTTAVDALLGLLHLDEGHICVDGDPLSPERVRTWQDQIGYVPQQIYLTDDTIGANIAFGVPKDKINHEALERSARLANLHDFILKELPEGYDTFVGERGVRLSGGQRQRIGIARALYLDPTVLIFDEATSALDTITERVIMEAVERLGQDKTIIMIAHRLSTVENCDRIFFLDKGRVADEGTYDELVERNETFRSMAG